MKSLGRKLERIYDEFGQQLFLCALAVTGSGELAEDAVHDAFYEVLRTGNVPGNLKAYLFRSVSNAAIDIMRRESRTVKLRIIEDIFECQQEPGRNAEIEQLLGRVAQGLSRLTESERETIMQHLVAGMTFRELAELQGRPIGSITSWYHRGITKLRQQMEKQDG